MGPSSDGLEPESLGIEGRGPGQAPGSSTTHQLTVTHPPGGIVPARGRGVSHTSERPDLISPSIAYKAFVLDGLTDNSPSRPKSRDWLDGPFCPGARPGTYTRPRI